jgi:hypothetical protein
MERCANNTSFRDDGGDQAGRRYIKGGIRHLDVLRSGADAAEGCDLQWIALFNLNIGAGWGCQVDDRGGATK